MDKDLKEALNVIEKQWKQSYLKYGLTLETNNLWKRYYRLMKVAVNDSKKQK
ncbi:MAG: hypothetical protein KAS32_30710 [Candidatus Peribacteraceae bacterium]|nr:hypothetical protein [Candidatus Peribacteraceae bacterium]